MSDINHINNLVSSYVKAKDTDYAIMIFGDWGCGKTYYVENELKEIIKNSQASQTPKASKELLYISLYGIQSVEEIDTRILNSVSGVYRWATALKPILNVGSDVAETFCKPLSSVKSIFKSKNISALNKFLQSPQNYVYVFDDLERIGNIDTKDVLSYINDLCEHKKCKVIVVCNEEKSKELKEFKEKTVRYSVQLQCDILKVFDSFIGKYEENFREYIGNNKSFICEIFQASQCNNLRTLSFVLDILEGLYKATPNSKYKDIVNKQFICFTVIYSIEYKEGRTTEELNSLKHLGLTFNYSPKDDNTTTYLQRTRTKYERFVGGNRVFQNIADYIVSGVIEESSFYELNDNLIKEIKSLEETEEGKICSQISSVSMDENNFSSCIKQFIEFLKNGTLNCAPTFLVLLYGRLLEFEEDGIENFRVTEEITDLFKENIEKSGFYDAGFNVLYIPDFKSDNIEKKYEALYQFAYDYNKDIASKKIIEESQQLLSAIDNNDVFWFRKPDVINNLYLYKHVDANVLFEKLKKADMKTIEYFVECFRGQFDGHIKFEPQWFGDFFESFESIINAYIKETPEKTLRFRYFIRLNRFLSSLSVRSDL